MNTYKIDYTLKGTLEVEAKTKKEAEKILKDTYFPELLDNVDWGKINDFKIEKEKEISVVEWNI